MANPLAQRVAYADDKLYFEDFAVGEVFDFGCRAIKREEIVSFARRYDPQPFHVDEQAARSTILEGLAASGWHVCTVFMGMVQEHFLSRCAWTALYAIDEIKWRIPVRPGDQLRCRITCIGHEGPARRGGAGICTLFCEALNGRGQTVMSWRLQLELQSARGTGLGDAERSGKHDVRRQHVTRMPGNHAITFFEDVYLGNEISLGSYTFTSEGVANFHKRYGPHPIHPDATPDRLCASGWHVTAAWMQRLVRYYMREAANLRATGRRVPQLGPSPGITNLRWHRPVYAGDKLTFSCWADRKTAVRSRPDWGLLLSGIEVKNQYDECVLSFYAMLLLERRAKA